MCGGRPGVVAGWDGRSIVRWVVCLQATSWPASYIRNGIVAALGFLIRCPGWIALMFLYALSGWKLREMRLSKSIYARFATQLTLFTRYCSSASPIKE